MTNSIDGSTTGIALTQKAFESGLGSFGISFVAICLFFFAFSTIIGWYFFGEQNIKYLFGTKGTTPYRLIVMGFIVLGSVLQVDLVWELADMFNGLMVLPNLIASSGFPKSSAWRSKTTTQTIRADPPSTQSPSEHPVPHWITRAFPWRRAKPVGTTGGLFALFRRLRGTHETFQC